MELTELKKIIAQVLKISEDRITEDSALVSDLGANSLDLFEILLAVEEHYDIEFDPETAESLVYVRDAVEAIQSRIGYQKSDKRTGKKAKK